MGTDCSIQNGSNFAPDVYSISDNSTYYLTRGKSVGLTIVAEAGLVSLLAVLYVFLIILECLWRTRNVSRDKWHVFQTPMDLLMFSLFSADLLQAVGSVMNAKWINEGSVQVGDFCTAQGTLKLLGQTGVAIATLLITLYTFLGLWLGKAIRSMRITRVVLFIAWLFVILVTFTGSAVNRGPNKTPFISPTMYWCWISKPYFYWRIWGEYFWLWIAVGFSIVAYVPLWVWSRGNVVFHAHSWWKFKFQHADVNADRAFRGLRRRSLIMLAYPFVSCISVLPQVIVRWITFSNGGNAFKVSSAATLAADTLFGLSGFFNVVLLLTTRPDSVLFAKQLQFSSGRAPSLGQVGLHSEEVQSFQDEDDSDLGRLPSRS